MPPHPRSPGARPGLGSLAVLCSEMWGDAGDGRGSRAEGSAGSVLAVGCCFTSPHALPCRVSFPRVAGPRPCTQFCFFVLTCDTNCCFPRAKGMHPFLRPSLALREAVPLSLWSFPVALVVWVTACGPGCLGVSSPRTGTASQGSFPSHRLPCCSLTAAGLLANTEHAQRAGPGAPWGAGLPASRCPGSVLGRNSGCESFVASSSSPSPRLFRCRELFLLGLLLVDLCLPCLLHPPRALR